MSVRAIVMKSDRDWALAQKPDEIRMHDDKTDDELRSLTMAGGWMARSRKGMQVRHGLIS